SSSSSSSESFVDVEEVVEPIHLFWFFEGNDYDSWKRRISVLIRSKELESTIENENGGDAKKRAKAYELIVNHLDNNIFRLIRENSDPYKLLRELDERYIKVSEAKIVALRT
ncbi:hypothetical protein U1Q18_052189, partial [Sarracenia purpurea var. burkii]